MKIVDDDSALLIVGDENKKRKKEVVSQAIATTVRYDSKVSITQTQGIFFHSNRTKNHNVLKWHMVCCDESGD